MAGSKSGQSEHEQDDEDEDANSDEDEGSDSVWQRISEEVFAGRECPQIARCRRVVEAAGVGKVVFVMGRKVTGDVHVPTGALSFGAMVEPPIPLVVPARGGSGRGGDGGSRGGGSAAGSGGAGSGDDEEEEVDEDAEEEAAANRVFAHITDRATGKEEPVIRRWLGWGTLAFPMYVRDEEEEEEEKRDSGMVGLDCE